ncbi:MAG: hypothetical protein Kow00124_28550 [Anaerolineae bacterium]
MTMHLQFQLNRLSSIANAVLSHQPVEVALQEIAQAVDDALGFGAVGLYRIDVSTSQMAEIVRAGSGRLSQDLEPANALIYQKIEPALKGARPFEGCYYLPPEYSRQSEVSSLTHLADDVADMQIDAPPGTLWISLFPFPEPGVLGVVLGFDAFGGIYSSAAAAQMLGMYAKLAALVVASARPASQPQLAGLPLTDRAVESKLDGDAKHRLDERVRELEQIVDQLKAEIGRHEASESQLQQRNRELLSLHAAITATASCLDLSFVLDTVTWELSSLLGLSGCSILELAPDAGTLKEIASYGHAGQPPRLQGKVILLSSLPYAEQLINERTPQQFNIDREDISDAQRAYLRQQASATIVLFPMIYHHRVIGVVELRDQSAAREISERELSLAQALVSQAASAITNARLYEQSRLEIAMREEAEQKILASLREKEVLLQEVHHRVKNNLQIISSMLNLQLRNSADPEIVTILRDSQSRIRSIALIHELLYRSSDLARIDFGAYIQNLISHLLSSYRDPSRHISIEVDAKDIALPIKQAVPCGLIINELVSNSIKHAFPRADRPAAADRVDTIRVAMHRGSGGQIELTVSDNGVGISSEMDLDNTSTLGMQIVNTLVRQLGGTLTVSSNAGTSFVVTFSLDSVQ